jgi:hypothetical protein
MSTISTRDNRQNSVSLADEEAVKKVLIDSVLGLWDTVNNLTRYGPRVTTAIGSRVSVQPAQSPAVLEADDFQRIVREVARYIEANTKLWGHHDRGESFTGWKVSPPSAPTYDS